MIPLKEFALSVDIIEKGGLKADNGQFIENGFAIRTENYTYYGILKNNQICELCLERFESVDEEFCTISSAFGLALTNWCNGSITLA